VQVIEIYYELAIQGSISPMLICFIFSRNTIINNLEKDSWVAISTTIASFIELLLLDHHHGHPPSLA
jgi:hypothetical protein